MLLRILLSNDDGIKSKGLFVLAEILQKEHELIIVAPNSERSASGHSITIGKPLIIKEEKLSDLSDKIDAYSLSGTPADCVKFALQYISKKPIDLVISGINTGLNLGTDILYSGTVSAAIEGAINNIPAIAVSIDSNESYDNYYIAEEYIKKAIEILGSITCKNMVLNLNIPKEQHKIKGIKLASIGSRKYSNVYNETYDELNGRIIEYSSIGEFGLEEGTDTYYFTKNYVTITPLHYDLTNFELMSKIENLI